MSGGAEGGELGQSGARAPAQQAIAYLFTDIEGSTLRWERAPEAMRAALRRHDAIIARAVEGHGGYIHDRAGDGVFAIFSEGDPLGCALEIQIQLQACDWREVAGLKVRIGVHTGTGFKNSLADRTQINRAARITEAAWGGQIVLSEEASRHLPCPPGAELVSLGWCRLRGVDEPISVMGLTHPHLTQTAFPPLRSIASEDNGLPPQRGDFIGRDEERAALAALIGASKWITITGAGGNGKTRLACEAARSMLATHAVYFVSLALVEGEDSALNHIAAALRLPMAPGVNLEQSIIAYLRDKKVLIVLDNADQLAGRISILARLGAACPGLCVLATSRGPLKLAEEELFALRGLASPSRNDEDMRSNGAYRFFLQEAKSEGESFELDENEFEDFRGICASLGGSPLGLRMAAQWSRLLPLKTVHARLRTHPDLISNPGDAQSHSGGASLRSVFEGTWSSLAPAEQGALARLSVFEGTFDWRAADIGVHPESLLILQQKGLVEARAARRLALHPLVKAYAQEKLQALGEAEATRSQYISFFLGKAAQVFSSADAEAQEHAQTELDLDLDNIAAAWRTASKRGQVELLERVLDPLFFHLVSRAQFAEALRLFDVELISPAFDAHCAALRANCLAQQGEFIRAEAICREVLAQGALPALVRAHALHALGNAAQMQGDLEGAKRHYAQASELRRAGAETRGRVFSLLCLASVSMAEGAMSEAREWIKETYVLSQASGNGFGEMMAFFLSGDVALREQRHEDAQSNFEDVLRMEGVVRHGQYRANALMRLGIALRALGEYDCALEQHERALADAVELGDKRLEANVVLQLAEDTASQANWPRSRNHALEAARLALKIGARPILYAALQHLAKAELHLGNGQEANRILTALGGDERGEPDLRQQGVRRVAVQSRRGGGDLASSEKEAIQLRDLVEELQLAHDLAALRL